MGIETFLVLDILYFLGLLLGLPWLDPEKILERKVHRRLESTILRLFLQIQCFIKEPFY